MSFLNKKNLQLDDIDKTIIKTLSSDSRKSSRQLASELGVSHQTVLSRIRQLEKAGVIKQYTLVVDFDKVGFPVKTMTLIEAGKLGDTGFRKIEEYLKSEPCFISASQLDGTFDLYVVGVFRDQKEAKEKLLELRNVLSKHVDLKSFKNHAIWQTIKHTHSVNISLDE